MKRAAYFYILFAAVLWGTIGIFIRHLSKEGFDSLQLVALRAYISMVILVVYYFIRDKRKLKIRLKDSWCFIGTGIFSFVFFNFCYFKAIQLTFLSVASILLYTAPILVMVMSLFLFHETFTVKKLIALFLAFGGCVLVTGLGGDRTQVSTAGILFGLLSGFGYALYSIFARYGLERYDFITVTIYTFIAASIGVTPITDVKGIFVILASKPVLIFEIILFAFSTSVLSYLFYTKGLVFVEPSKASIMASIEPVVATLIGMFFFEEKLNALAFLGIFCVLTALVVLNIGGSLSKPKEYS